MSAKGQKRTHARNRILRKWFAHGVLLGYWLLVTDLQLLEQVASHDQCVKGFLIRLAL
jgi:hypothetical protein